jgi:hypothetical protein
MKPSGYQLWINAVLKAPRVLEYHAASQSPDRLKSGSGFGILGQLRPQKLQAPDAVKLVFA